MLDRVLTTVIVVDTWEVGITTALCILHVFRLRPLQRSGASLTNPMEHAQCVMARTEIRLRTLAEKCVAECTRLRHRGFGRYIDFWQERAKHSVVFLDAMECRREKPSTIYDPTSWSLSQLVMRYPVP